MKILLHGSYFGLNFGDTLLCRLFADWIKAADVENEVFLPLANDRNAALIGSARNGLSTIGDGEALLLCGGGYLGEPKSGIRKWTARAYLRHILLARHCAARKPLAILGVGVGPITSPRLQRDIVGLFEAAEMAVVRDDTSAEYLRKWGLKRDVTVATDAVVTALESELRGTPRAADPALADLKARCGKLICIHAEGEPSAKELALSRAFVDWVLQNTPYGIVVTTDSVPRRRSTTWVDRFAIDEAYSARVFRSRYDGDPQNMITMLGAMDLIVTTKLHVGIVGCCLRVPVISLPRHTKTPRFYQQMGLGDWCLEGGAGQLENLRGRFQEWDYGLRPDYAVFDVRRQGGYYRDAIGRLYSAVQTRA